MLKTEKQMTDNAEGSRGWMSLPSWQDFPHFELLSKAQTEQMSMGSSKKRGKLGIIGSAQNCLTYLMDLPGKSCSPSSEEYFCLVE